MANSLLDPEYWGNTGNALAGLLSAPKRVGNALLDAYQTLTQPGRFDQVASDYIMNTPQRFRDNVNSAFPDPRLLNPNNQTPEAQGARESAANALLNFAAPIVYHGSPHSFTKFDSSKIGTGEGAQAYGHGLYVADSPEVAGQYAKNIMGPTATPENVALKVMNAGRDPAQRLKQVYPSMTDAEIQTAISNAKDYQGNTYKVNLDDAATSKMLDWDKTLGEQPDLLKTVFDLGLQRSLYRKNPSKQIGDFTGADVMGALGADSHSRALLADDLARAGIPGVKYLDGGSRGAGQGSSNYVVFPGNEGLLQILERNGQPVK